MLYTDSSVIIMSEVIQVPAYKAEDFTDTTAPYEFLYTYKDNKFVLSQLLQKMKERASAVGIRSFVSMWNAYMKTKEHEDGVKLENATNFDGQPLELFSGRYICDDGGITTSSMFGEVMVCRHPIMPVRRLINVDTGEERMEIAYKPGRTWRPNIVVEKLTIASTQSIISLASNGVAVNAENARLLSTYLFEMEQLNYDTIPEQKSVGRLGWISDHGFSPFVDGLAFDGEQNYKFMFDAVKSFGDRNKWLDGMRSFRAEKTIGRIFLAASFASVLIEPLGLLPFFVHAWGGTGNGKTVCLMAAASVWGAPDGDGLITTFNATDVGQEMTASFLNSLPMCIDELQIQTTAGAKDFDRMVYMLTEGKGKRRGARSGGLRKQTTWRNCMLTTGESPITRPGSAGGAVNRIIEFECYESIAKDLPALAALVKENYGFAGREFVEHLQQPGVLDLAKTIQQNYYQELNKYDSTEKLAASASVILTADAIATQLFWQDHNELTVKDFVDIMASKDDVDVNRRAFDYMQELVARNPAHFAPNLSGEYSSEVWGVERSDLVYIIKSVFDREMEAAGYNPAAFLAWAKRNGNIVCDKGGRRTKKARIGESVVNTVCLRREVPRGFTPDD